MSCKIGFNPVYGAVRTRRLPKTLFDRSIASRQDERHLAKAMSREKADALAYL